MDILPENKYLVDLNWRKIPVNWTTDQAKPTLNAKWNQMHK